MNWHTSVRVKDDKEIEHVLNVATSLPAFGSHDVVDVLVDEIDANGNKVRGWDMRYDMERQVFIFPKETAFNRNIIKEMQTIVETGAEQW